MEANSGTLPNQLQWEIAQSIASYFELNFNKFGRPDDESRKQNLQVL